MKETINVLMFEGTLGYKLPGMFSRVLGHVDHLECHLGSVESSLDHGVRVTHEGVDCSVGGGSRVNI